MPTMYVVGTLENIWLLQCHCDFVKFTVGIFIVLQSWMMVMEVVTSELHIMYEAIITTIHVGPNDHR